jgi:hypothetical protein
LITIVGPRESPDIALMKVFAAAVATTAFQLTPVNGEHRNGLSPYTQAWAMPLRAAHGGVVI